MEFDSMRNPFEFVRAVIDGLEEPFGQLERVGTHDDRVGFCRRLNSRCQIGRISNDRIGLAVVFLVQVSNDHQTRMDADAHVNAHARFLEEALPNGGHRLDDTESGLNRSPGVVLMSGGITKIG